MPEDEKSVSDSTSTPEREEQASSPTPPAFDKDAFIAEYTKREKDSIARAIAPLQKEIRRLSALASLKEMPEEQREMLADRGSINTDAAELVKDRFNLPDDLLEDILAKGSYKEMIRYGERMSRVLGSSRNETKSIAQELAQEKSVAMPQPTPAAKTPATEKVMTGSASRTVSSLPIATKENIDKLWVDAEMAGGENPYDEQYRKFIRTGSL